MFLLGLAGIFGAVHMARALFDEGSLPIFPFGEIPEQIAKLRNELDNLKAEIDNELAQLVDPGPEPSRWHIWDHYWWQDRVDRRNQIQSEIKVIQKKIDDNQAAIQSLRKSSWSKPFGQARTLFVWVWTAFIRRALDVLLFLAFIGFSTEGFFQVAADHKQVWDHAGLSDENRIEG